MSSHSRRSIACFFFIFLLTLFAVLTLSTGCESLENLCRSVEICDEEPPEPILVDLLCDTSPGSSCTQSTLKENLDQILPYLLSRPHSIIRTWNQGSAVSDTIMVSQHKITVPKKSGTQALRSYRESFLVTAKAEISSAILNLNSSEGKNRSPIIEGISKVAMAGSAGGLPRTIIIITDGRQFSSIADFECADKLPSTEEFLKKLDKNQLLEENSLTGTRIIFSFINSTPIKGRRNCSDVTIKREKHIQRLLTVALTRAGATEIRFETGPTTFKTD